MDVTYLLDSPQSMEWKGIFVDADLRAIEVLSDAQNQEEDNKTIFMQLASMEGSFLESAVLEVDFGVESISTAKLMGLANESGIPILTINSDNIGTVLPALSFADNIKEDITNSVNQGLIIEIPQTEITYEDWTGIGYIKEYPETGESGWMLSGMLAGGMSVWSGPDRWPLFLEFMAKFTHWVVINTDPTSGRYIAKIPATDMQEGVVGKPLLDDPSGKLLQVLVLDESYNRVSGALVTFKVKKGGGKLKDNDEWLDSVTVTTDVSGIASAKFKPGEKTTANPVFMKKEGTYSQQVGQNIIDAELPSGGIIATPFVVYGFPDVPVSLKMLFGDGLNNAIMSFAGFVSVAVEDKYENPISNEDVTFTSNTPELKSDPCNGETDFSKALLIKQEDECLSKFPRYDGHSCSTAATTHTVPTSHEGAAVSVILGKAPDATYTIAASTPNVTGSLEFSLDTYEFGNCDGYTEPDKLLKLVYLSASDASGNSINAAKTNSTIPLIAKLELLSEGETTIRTTKECIDGPVSCDKLVGSREFTTSVVNDGTITFTGQNGGPVGTGTSIGNGYYQFDYNVQSGVKEFSISGDAVVQRRYTDFCSGCYLIEENQSLHVDGVDPMKVYGVDMEIHTDLIIPVDRGGYLTADFPIEYTIGGDDYKASSVYLIVYKDDELYDYLVLETGINKETTLSRGTYFDPESDYKVEIVINYGSLAEVRSDVKPVYFSQYYIERIDPEFPSAKLKWDDYYPALGDKTIVIRGIDADDNGEFIPLNTGSVKAEIVYPTQGMTLDSSVSVTTLDENFVDGRVEFTLSATEIAPPINNDVTTGLDKIEILFNVFDDDDNKVGFMVGKWNIKNNSNTNLKEVLDGQAIFAIDVDSNGAVKTGDNHKGQTTGNTPETQEFDYVLKMINHIVPILRTPVSETNQENTLSNYGYYGSWTENVINALLTGGNSVNIGSDASPKNVDLVENIKISHQLNESGSINTLSKLVKDYSGLTDVNMDRGKVIDQEILVGLSYNENEKHPVNDSDIGIYELYENDDWDGDGVSNYLEVENINGDPISDQNRPIYIDTVARGYHGVTRITLTSPIIGIGPGELARVEDGNAVVVDGVKVADGNTGYYYFRSGDPEDEDNYAVIETLQKIEDIGKAWAEIHPELAPFDSNIFTRANNGEGRGMRFGIGDLSARGGGECHYVCIRFDPPGVCAERGEPFQFEPRTDRTIGFRYLAHNTHENGLDVDVRYMRNDDNEGRVDFSATIDNDHNANVYSLELTEQLIKMFIDQGAETIYVDYYNRAGFIDVTGGSNTITTDSGNTATIIGMRGHHHHFHVTFPEMHLPEGTIAITASPASIQANGQSTTTITTDVIRDDKGVQLLEYTALTVETSLGEIVTEDAHPSWDGHQIRTNADG
ncbi:MAG: hypothetical protein PVG39_28380, partial [Desulfobacteraceae bacterium]